MGRIEHGFNVRPDLCAVDNDINPRKYLGKFWTDSLVHDAQALDLLVKVIGEVMSKTVKSSHSTETVIAYHVPVHTTDVMLAVQTFRRVQLILVSRH